MEIKRMDNSVYKGRKFTVNYISDGYYDIIHRENGFDFEYVNNDKPLNKSFDDVMMSEWLEDPIAYGVFEGDRLIGFIEGSIESWNNRFRISNICVFDERSRYKGIGDMLIGKMIEYVQSTKARMIVLETQTCNNKAISFYRKYGFEIIGFDLYAYTNHDADRHEVRIEMGRIIDNEKTS